MARRGEELREHMLLVAKDVFLEAGFERASMDVIASRADTTKRTLYAHFESKENLFLAVVELVRGLLVSRLKMPGDYAADPHDALVLFCARFLDTMVRDRSIRMSRLSIAEVERFPDGAARRACLLCDGTKHAPNHDGMAAAADDGRAVEPTEHPRERRERPRSQDRPSSHRLDLEAERVAREAVMAGEDEPPGAASFCDGEPTRRTEAPCPNEDRRRRAEEVA